MPNEKNALLSIIHGGDFEVVQNLNKESQDTGDTQG